MPQLTNTFHSSAAVLSGSSPSLTPAAGTAAHSAPATHPPTPGSAPQLHLQHPQPRLPLHHDRPGPAQGRRFLWRQPLWPPARLPAHAPPTRQRLRWGRLQSAAHRPQQTGCRGHPRFCLHGAPALVSQLDRRATASALCMLLVAHPHLCRPMQKLSCLSVAPPLSPFRRPCPLLLMSWPWPWAPAPKPGAHGPRAPGPYWPTWPGPYGPSWSQTPCPWPLNPGHVHSAMHCVRPYSYAQCNTAYHAPAHSPSPLPRTCTSSPDCHHVQGDIDSLARLLSCPTLSIGRAPMLTVSHWLL